MIETRPILNLVTLTPSSTLFQYLLPLLNKGVVLGDPFQRQLVHEVDLVGVLQVFPHERLHGEGESGGVEQDLSAVKEISRS